MTIKPGPKPIAKSTGKSDTRCRVAPENGMNINQKSGKIMITQSCTTPPRPIRGNEKSS